MNKTSISFPNNVEKPEITWQKIISESERVLAYSATFFFKDLDILASGTDENKDTAFKKAYCEAMERIFLTSTKKNTATFRAWKLSSLNSTCGMAAGFNLKNTINRSLEETAERYLRALLYTGNLGLKKESTENNEFLNSIFANFYSCALHSSEVQVNGLKKYFSLCSAITTLNKKKRVFLGYCLHDNSLSATHQSSIEAYRNYIIVKKLSENEYVTKKNQSHYKKIQCKSQQLDDTLKILDTALAHKTNEITLPNSSWSRKIKYHNTYLCRTFLDGYLENSMFENSL